jgi:ABC-type glycerol-3-phosphate transport system substrate-binding protein
MNRKLNVFLSLTLALMFVLAACAPAATPTEAPKPAATEAPAMTEAPAVDPMAALVEESKNEKDGLLVYSIMGESNWAPVIAAFNAKYPWITVTALDLGTTETFERYYTESAGGARTADMIITSAPGEWQEFIAKGELEVYHPVNLEGMPDFATLADGVYAVSTDPFIIIYNKQLVPTPPTTMATLPPWRLIRLLRARSQPTTPRRTAPVTPSTGSGRRRWATRVGLPSKPSANPTSTCRPLPVTW